GGGAGGGGVGGRPVPAAAVGRGSAGAGGIPGGTNPRVTVPRVRPRGTVLQAWSCGRRRGHGPRGRAAWPGPWVPGTAAGTTGGPRALRAGCPPRRPDRERRAPCGR